MRQIIRKNLGNGMVIKSTIARDGQSFSGYGIGFGTDLEGDRFARDCIAPGTTVPLCREHAHKSSCGVFTFEKADDRGYLGRGRIVTATEAGREAAALLLAGALPALSVGGRVVKATGSNPRVIHALDPFEVSLCVRGVNADARVTALKSVAMDIAKAMRERPNEAHTFTIPVDLAKAIIDGSVFPRDSNVVSARRAQDVNEDPIFPRAWDFIARETATTGAAHLVGVTTETRDAANVAEGAIPPTYDVAFDARIAPNLSWASLTAQATVNALVDSSSVLAYIQRSIIDALRDRAEIDCINAMANGAGSIPIAADFLSACAHAAEYVAKKHTPTAVLVNAADCMRVIGVRDGPMTVGGTVPIVPLRTMPVGVVLGLNRNAATFFSNAEAQIDVGFAGGDLVEGTRTINALLGHQTLIAAASGISKATYP